PVAITGQQRRHDDDEPGDCGLSAWGKQYRAEPGDWPGSRGRHAARATDDAGFLRFATPIHRGRDHRWHQTIGKDYWLPTLKEVEYVTIAKDPNHAHCLNQVNIRALRDGTLAVIYNEERFPFHHDTGQSVIIRSRDGGLTWDYERRQVVLPY